MGCCTSTHIYDDYPRIRAWKSHFESLGMSEEEIGALHKLFRKIGNIIIIIDIGIIIVIVIMIYYHYHCRYCHCYDDIIEVLWSLNDMIDLYFDFI